MYKYNTHNSPTFPYESTKECFCAPESFVDEIMCDICRQS